MKISKLFVAMLLPILIFISCSSDNSLLIHNEPDQVDADEKPKENESNEQQEDFDDVAKELIANDLSAHPMQDVAKPGYLQTIIDPSFGTTIRRISDAGDGNVIKPMYSTIQAWNTDETYMILYDQSKGLHQLLDGMSYTFIRYLDDIQPDDLEQIFWDFNDPDIFFYLDSSSSDFIKYTVSTKEKITVANLQSLASCSGNIGLGNDVQMMSWDSDVLGFRCDNNKAYAYRISTETLTEFAISDVNYIAPMPSASGSRFYHNQKVFNATGEAVLLLNEQGVEHSCLGKLANGNDAHFAVAFEEGPQGGCSGNIIAHDLTTGECFPVISQAQGYDYAKSGTHISAVAHKNPGWIAASMIGYEEDGQKLLDQELIVARVEKGNVQVYRIGHHRADENEFDYWGEPHAVISPKGTRVLFGSDWSGAEDGKSVDSYVVELPAFNK